MFGTDISFPELVCPLPDYLRNAHRDGRISEEAYEKITWRNASRIFNLDLA